MISPDDKQDPSDDRSDYHKTSGTELLQEIISNAKEGKVTNSDIKAGETHVNVVEDKFGSPDEQETITQGTYLAYPNQNLSFGYGTEGIIFDVRSYLPELQQIKYDTTVENEPNR
ncbi:DUF4309 domain-containing protein [Pseudalkalibacillus sp. A8]|uniref:DUF4309 domain-containing protein n=1 Tax=Pseudalkalibacillus sp. A8 TaxID=3382641 RepID=UPI0038B5CDA2